MHLREGTGLYIATYGPPSPRGARTHACALQRSSGPGRPRPITAETLLPRTPAR